MNPAQRIHVPLAFERAVNRFRQTLTDGEHKIFRHLTSEQDVWDLVEELQNEQGSRMSLQNMGRIEPFISGMRQYASVIEVFVQVKPEIMALIWGPLKLLLELASKFIDSFETMLDAIGRIGESLPRFRRFAEIFSYSDQMQEVISTVYEDIMEFYRRALKFFRRRAWKVVFSLTWTTFESRFGLILSNLKRHQSLVDSEARAEDIVQSHKAREEEKKRIEKLQKDEMIRRMKEVVAWLEPVNTDDRDKATALKSPGTGIWLAGTKEVKEWINGKGKLIWLTGKPGSGKTILSSAILEHLEEEKQSTKSSWPTLYFFCSYRQPHSNTCTAILRTFIYQIIEQKRDLLAYAYEGLMKPLSVVMLKQLFYDLLEASVPVSEYVYIIIDGLDELQDSERKIILPILKELRSTAKNRPQLGSVCRTFVASRDLLDIRTEFHKPKAIEISILGKNTDDILQYIDFESQRVVEELGLDPEMGRLIFDSLCKRADGMFLWVHLIIESLILQTTRGEILATLEDLPKGLDQAYERILQRIKLSAQEEKTRKILEWMTCASRTLKIGELEDAMAINYGDATLDDNNRLLKDRLRHLCGPIIEFSQDNIIFVHFSAKEYLLSRYSGPFIDYGVAHFNISLVCATYQCFHCFESTLSTEQAAGFVLNGDLRLFDYVNSNWLEHVKGFCKLGPDSLQLETLSVALQELFKRRSTQLSLGSPLNASPETITGFEVFGCFESRINAALIKVLDYRERLTQKVSGLGPGDELVSWCNENNPLTLDQSGRLLQNALEGLLNAQPPVAENIDRLQRIYGPNLYMCRYQFCQMSSSGGFLTEGQRKIHEDKHAKSHRCQVQNCIYGNRDFTSKGKLQKHMKDYHAVTTIKKSAVALGILVNDGQQLGRPSTFDSLLNQADVSEKFFMSSVNSPSSFYYDGLDKSSPGLFGGHDLDQLFVFRGTRRQHLGRPESDIMREADEIIGECILRFNNLKEGQYFQDAEGPHTEIVLRQMSSQLKSWRQLVRAFHLATCHYTYGGNATKRLVFNVLRCREQYTDDFETPRGKYSMSASMVGRTSKLLARCFNYIQNFDKIGKAEDLQMLQYRARLKQGGGLVSLQEQVEEAVGGAPKTSPPKDAYPEAMKAEGSSEVAASSLVKMTGKDQPQLASGAPLPGLSRKTLSGGPERDLQFVVHKLKQNWNPRGWQVELTPAERGSGIIHMYKSLIPLSFLINLVLVELSSNGINRAHSLRLVRVDIDYAYAIQISTNFERSVYDTVEDKVTYRMRLRSKLLQIREVRESVLAKEKLNRRNNQSVIPSQLRKPPKDISAQQVNSYTSTPVHPIQDEALPQEDQSTLDKSAALPGGRTVSPSAAALTYGSAQQTTMDSPPRSDLKGTSDNCTDDSFDDGNATITPDSVGPGAGIQEWEWLTMSL